MVSPKKFFQLSILDTQFLNPDDDPTPKENWAAKYGLSQQGVWVPFWTPKPLKGTPQDTQCFLCGISKNVNLKRIIELFHLLLVPMTLFDDIIPYFDEFVHGYGLKYEYFVIPLKNLDAPKFYNCQF